MTIALATSCQMEHAQLRLLAAETRGLLSAPHPPADISVLVCLRLKFAHLITAHHHGEHGVLLPLLIRSANLEARRLGTRFKASTDLASEVSAHRLRWSLVRVQREWDAYRTAALALIDRIEEQIDLEDRELYPWIDEAGPTLCGFS